MGASILQDLVVVMIVAAAVTILFYRLKQPVVLGYLLGGVLVGPNTLGLIKDAESIHGLSDLGIIFLMFAVGLEFDLKKLRKVGASAAIAAALEVSAMLAIGYYLGTFVLGWNQMDSIFLGAVMSISSTTIIVKILTEMGKVKEEHAEVAFGILIIEDILAVVIVALLTAMGTTGTFQVDIIPSVIGGVILFVFVFVAVGLVLVPRLIDVVSKFHVEEVLVITVVGLAFGAALLAQNVGFSLALGAFLIGAIIAESKAVRRVEHKIVPIRDLFTAMFFVAVGMLIDPRMLLAYWQPILVIAVATVIGKVVAVTIATYLVGYDGRTAVKTGTALGQIGEFSFIIAGLGVLSLHVVRPELYPIAIAVCALTTLCTPIFVRGGPKVADGGANASPRWWIKLLTWYTHGVRKITSRPIDPLTRPDHKRARHGTRMVIYAAWLFGLLIMAAYVSAWAGAEVQGRLPVGEDLTRAASIGFLGLTGLPLFVAFTKAAEAYIFAGAKARAMNPKHLSKQDARYRRPKFIARTFSAIASIVLVGAAIRIAWGIHPLAIPNLWLLIPILVVLTAIGAIFWHPLERLYLGMEKTLNELMGHEADLHPDEERNLRLKERLPWGMDVEEVHIRPIDRAAYMNLKDLNLRDVSGASILSIERGSKVMPNPHPDVVLLPHDRVILIGKRDQLTRAAGFMSVLSPRAEPVVEQEVRVPASSPAMAQPLGSLQIEQTGAKMGLIRKADGSFVAPSPRVTLEPDDHVTLYGSEASIGAARERLKLRTMGAHPKMGPGGR
ncbi:MAG: monovalent cation:H+ antiporter-2, family [Thermoplasmata archaeon]|jgi:CPA2 family monovalent cation:H+ antiporter-2|nr:monovalent cation:H+ antiporter-2, family [Thermoplasmata archaeon]